MKEQIVEIHLVSIQELQQKKERILPEIAPRYRERFVRPGVEEECWHSLGAGYLLWKWMHVTKDAEITCSEQGKPALQSGFKQISISHSGEYIALALADNPVGIDIEPIQEIVSEVFVKVGDSKILQKIGCASEGERPRVETEYWTQLEAVGKLLGTGLDTPVEILHRGLRACSIQTMEYPKNYFLTCAMKKNFRWKIDGKIYEPASRASGRKTD